MGLEQKTISEEAQKRYETAFDTLACRCLGEPYNFHRVLPLLLPGLLNSDLPSAAVVQSCLRQFAAKGDYSPQSVALDCNIPATEALEMAQRDSEMTLTDAMDTFMLYHGQWAEMRIARFVDGWVMKGMSSEEIQSETAKARKEFGLSARLEGSDGKEQFESKLIAALEGKVYTYPVSPYLQGMRDVVPYYEPGDYIVVAALSGQGKTYDALNQIYYNSIHGVPSCYINLEMTPDNVQKRIWQMHSSRQFKSDMRGSDAEVMDAIRKWEEVKKMPFASYNPGRSIEAIVSTIRQDYYERGIQFAAVDYAQKMTSNTYRGARNYELGEISSELRALALELGIPIYVLAQLKQEVARTSDKRGGMYDIKDCADFTQDATMVQILYRPGYFNITHYETASGGQEIYPENYADKFIAKGREIGTSLIPCRFDHIRGFYDAQQSSMFPSAMPDQMPNIINQNRPSDNEDIPF